MTKYRNALPLLDGGLFLTDAGIETTLIYEDGLDLPYFAAFHLLRDARGRAALSRYYRRHAGIARAHGLGFVLESATWRASADWGARLGYTPEQLAAANRQAVEMLVALRAELETAGAPMVISGCVGPRGDGYLAGELMSPAQAAAYHWPQVETFAASAADLVTAITMTNSNEAIGVAQAARAAAMPVVISFTVETDGRLPTGQPLAEAIAEVDAATGAAPLYYMVNCAHPSHFEAELTAGADWLARLRGLRANASTRSHAELDAATELDAGDPEELGRQYAVLRQRLGQLSVVGGCCGTDHRHIEQIARACAGETRQALAG